MNDLGKDLYEFYLITMARFNMPVNKGWKDLTPEEKHAWHDIAMDFGRLIGET